MKNKEKPQAEPVKNYNFGEKAKENYKTKEGWQDLEVWQTPKYLISRNKAIELIESKIYGLDEGDFWILKNQGGKKLCYTGLIISHNGCLKINDVLPEELKFDPESVSFLKDASGEKVMQYISKSQKIYEFGEISSNNCRNEYPYAMVLKRLMDRVILKTSKIGFFGIYSEAESDSFKEVQEEVVAKMVIMHATKEDKNAFGLSNDGSLADNSDMKETMNKKNEQDFAGLKSIIESCGGEEELKEVWLNKDNVKVVNSLKKWRPELYKLLVEAKDVMKSSFSGKDQIISI